MQQSPLAGRVALVTGAGRGIGRATAARLAQAGCPVVLVGRTAAALEETRAARVAAVGRAGAYPADVADEAACEAIFDRATRELGPVELLVNNAGAIEVAPIETQRYAAFTEILATNVAGAWLYSRALFRRLIATGRPGAIVNLASLGGLAGTTKFPGFSAYVASKFAVVGLTEALATEGRPHAIRVNCVAPGAVETAMLHKAAPFLKTSTTPADVAEIIFFLCDPTRAGKLTGVTIPIHSNE